MGNVASWSGSKTLSCFQYYDQVVADFQDPERRMFHSSIHLNWASVRDTSIGRPGGRLGPTIDAPTTRGPFKNIENEGYRYQQEFYPFSGKSFTVNVIIFFYNSISDNSI